MRLYLVNQSTSLYIMAARRPLMPIDTVSATIVADGRAQFQ